ncbi:hypothetical protein COO60DRAFT_669681 [Scenedesmus sp. NREL 46B-D3]|nr:hypothetical protein COO60DRAFT_669681 [Scenedesmus sp. NREL 46B-D3]
MATICEQTEPQFTLEGQGWLEMRLMRDKHELLEENIQLRKDLLQLQQEHITVLQQLAVCHAAEQQQRQVATADEQPAVSQTSTEPEQISATLQAQQQVLPEQQQQQQQQCLTAKLHPARQHSHHHHHHHHHHHRHSSKPPLTPQYQPSSSTAFLGMLTEGLFRDTCSSPSPASNRPASRESQGSTPAGMWWTWQC